jgi:SAM-dependent methyltransferase
MFQTNQCVACGNSHIYVQPTHLAKFVGWRISGNRPDGDIDISGMKCHECSFVGAVDRFTDAEETKLYQGYRGDEYNQMRSSCESEYNYADFIQDQQYYDYRKTGIVTLIDRHITAVDISTVLDYGGGDGALIPNNLLHAKRFVYDISNVPTINGVVNYDGSIDAFDFLMCCHVLEHKSDPSDLLKKIKQYIDTDSWIYFEIPNNPNPIIGKFHEHINFFNIKSLTALLERNGFIVIDSCEYGFDSKIRAHENNLCILAKLKE